MSTNIGYRDLSALFDREGLDPPSKKEFEDLGLAKDSWLDLIDLLPGGAGAKVAGAALGGLGGFMGRASKVMESLTDRKVPGETFTDTGKTLSKLYKDAITATSRWPGGVRPSTARGAFPVAKRTSEIPGLGWAKGVLSRDVDTLSTLGRLKASGRITSSTERALVSRVAREIHGESTIATRKAVLDTLKKELGKDHDLSTPAKVTDYLSAMMKSSAVGAKVTPYKRTLTEDGGIDLVGDGIESFVDKAFRAGMDDIGKAMHGTATGSAAKGAFLGATGFGAASELTGGEAKASDTPEIERLKREYPELSSELGRFGVSSSEYTPADLSSTGDYEVEETPYGRPGMYNAISSAVWDVHGDHPAGGYGLGTVDDGSGVPFSRETEPYGYGIPHFDGDLAAAKEGVRELMTPLSDTFTADMREKWAVPLDKWLDDAAAGNVYYRPGQGNRILPPKSIMPEGVILPSHTLGDPDFRAAWERGIDRVTSDPSYTSTDTSNNARLATDYALSELDYDLISPYEKLKTAEREAEIAALEAVSEFTKASHPETEPRYADTLSPEDLAEITGSGEFGESDRTERPGDIGKFLKDAISEAEVRKAWEDWADYGTPTDGSSDTIVVDTTTGVDILHDGSTPVLDMIGPGASGTFGDKMSYVPKGVTEAEFRPSGLARFGLGAGSLGAGLMTHSEPLGFGSDVPIVPYADPYPGMVDPTFVPDASTHYSDLLKHYDTETVPEHLPLSLTTPFTVAAEGREHAAEFAPPEWGYTPAMPPPSAYSYPGFTPSSPYGSAPYSPTGYSPITGTFDPTHAEIMAVLGEGLPGLSGPDPFGTPLAPSPLMMP